MILLLLKLIYRCGKFKQDQKVYNFLAFHEGVTAKTIQKHIKLLENKGFLSINSKTGHSIIKSFESIRKEKHLQVRLCFHINFYNYNKIKAVTGAVIYSYLHKDFWRKVKKKKSVQIKGCTYHFPNSKFNYKDKYAPVSVIGVSKVFNISAATASRLKKEAIKEKLISAKHNYSKESYDRSIKAYHKYENKQQNIVYRNGTYVLQVIDTICPLFGFSKRKTLKT